MVREGQLQHCAHRNQPTVQPVHCRSGSCPSKNGFSRWESRGWSEAAPGTHKFPAGCPQPTLSQRVPVLCNEDPGIRPRLEHHSYLLPKINSTAFASGCYVLRGFPSDCVR